MSHQRPKNLETHGQVYLVFFYFKGMDISHRHDITDDVP